MRSLHDFDWRGKTALLRADLNVPMHAGRIADDTRIRATLPTVQKLLRLGAGVVVFSHLGRPVAGRPEAAFSLAPVAARMEELLGRKICFEPDLDRSVRAASGKAVMMENTRFNIGETENSCELAARYAELGDIFVMDAFASAHRSEASTVALAAAAQGGCCAGLLLKAEIEQLDRALNNPGRPLVAAVGGAKIAGKLPVLCKLAAIADTVIVGGGAANAMLSATGTNVGASIDDKDMHATCRRLAEEHGGKILLPVDAVVGASPESETAQTKDIGSVRDGEMILDAGPASRKLFAEAIKGARTVIWNGALGVFENPLFAAGTRELAQAIAASPAYTVAGGGETAASANMFGIIDKLDCLSTGGGAFLEFVEGRELPAIAALG